ncbi:hypothetical protein [Ramlibacter sp. PS4R-6]|uniref:hypothetical protein n=1 Tax=Ramlibacter sp. PS4R-6 TaxID=3133438 RepID=UPI0030A7583B
MKLLRHLPQASGPALLGSFASLASQALFAAFLLKLFEPAAVGVFSLVNQVAFSWATLALAQSPLSLLADRADPAHGARRAWLASAVRMVWLLPLAALAWFWSSPATGFHASPLAWLAAIAITQMTWALAQSLVLRTGPGLSIFLVRCVPPALAVLIAGVGAFAFPRSEPTALLLAAVVGYAVGSLWLFPTLSARAPVEPGDAAQADGHDDRSSRLKLVHTLFDLASATLIAVQWTRVWGPVEAGYLLVLLRVYGFVPALVHTAWAQVLLSKGEARVRSSVAVGAACCAIVLVLGLLVQAALAFGWLAPEWAALRRYIWPLAIWQMAACLFGSLSHAPFLAGRARAYSLQCIGVDTMLLGLLVLAPLVQVAPGDWIMVVAGCMTGALLLQAAHFRALAR